MPQNIIMCRYGLRLVGHSLGGGTSSLLCWLLHNMPPDVPDWKPHLSSISCIAFACPPVLTADLAHSCMDHTTSIISQVNQKLSFAHPARHCSAASSNPGRIDTTKMDHGNILGNGKHHSCKLSIALTTSYSAHSSMLAAFSCSLPGFKMAWHDSFTSELQAVRPSCITCL